MKDTSTKTDSKHLRQNINSCKAQDNDRLKPDFLQHSYDETSNLFHALTTFFNSLCDERAVGMIKMRYGLEDGIPHTLRSVGQHFGFTKQRISQIELSRIHKLRHVTIAYLADEMSKPFNRMLVANGGVMREHDIAGNLPQFALLGNYHPAGVTRFILSIANNFTAIPDKVWALKEIPLAEIEHVRAKAIEIVSGNLSKMHIKELVSRISACLTTKNHKSSFIEACVRTFNRLYITDDGWCLLPKWQSSYIDDAVELIRKFGRPLHYKTIAKEINKLFTSVTTISEHSIYNRLLSLKDIFILADSGTFGLKEWSCQDP